MQSTSSQTTPLGPSHELFQNQNGTFSLKHGASGEVMHSTIGPKEEALQLYISQSRLAEKLLQDEYGTLVLFDVGLGAASNSLAALQCLRRMQGQREYASSLRPLDLISFENDLTGLALAYENRDKLPFFEGFETAVERLLLNGAYAGDGFQWTVLEGDFSKRIEECPPAELVYFDFYSPKVAPSLWAVSVFENLRKHCEPREGLGLSTELYTYSAATRVRVAMLLAGFFVGYGRATGGKTDTTAAATSFKALERPLDATWLDRVARSHEPFPYEWPHSNLEADRAVILEHLKRHPQFSQERPLRVSSPNT